MGTEVVSVGELLTLMIVDDWELIISQIMVSQEVSATRMVEVFQQKQIQSAEETRKMGGKFHWR